MINIDRDLAISLLERAVEEKGENYIYNDLESYPRDCVYAEPDGSPSCIVGHAFFYLGLLDDLNDGAIGDQAIAIVKLPEVSCFTHEAVRVFNRAQEAQDSGCSWGEALAAARAVA